MLRRGQEPRRRRWHAGKVWPHVEAVRGGGGQLGPQDAGGLQLQPRTSLCGQQGPHPRPRAHHRGPDATCCAVRSESVYVRMWGMLFF